MRLLGATPQRAAPPSGSHTAQQICKDMDKMADQEPATGGNGSGADGQRARRSAILAQYIKDLSVENPSAPQVYPVAGPAEPRRPVQHQCRTRSADDVHEVVLKIEVTARSDNGVHFVVDLTYAGLFGLRNVPEDALQPFLLIEAPRLLFPFARQVVADAVSDSGFPPLLLDPIDFAAAYMAQLQAQQAGVGEGGGEQAPPKRRARPDLRAPAD